MRRPVRSNDRERDAALALGLGLKPFQSGRGRATRAVRAIHITRASHATRVTIIKITDSQSTPTTRHNDALPQETRAFGASVRMARGDVLCRIVQSLNFRGLRPRTPKSRPLRVLEETHEGTSLQHRAPL